MKPDSATVKPESKPAGGKPRNLTYEGIRAHVEGMKAAAVAALPAYEVAKIHMPKRYPADHKEVALRGQVVKDADGFVELIEKVVLVRDLEAAKWDEKLAGLE